VVGQRRAKELYYRHNQRRVVIRPLFKSDLDFLLEVRNDSSTRYFLEDDRVFTKEQCEKWFDDLILPWWTIEYLGYRVGYIRTSINDGKLNIGIDIHPNCRKQGLAQEAYRKVLCKLRRCYLWTFEDNFAISLYTKLGFQKTSQQKTIRGRSYIEMKYEKNEMD